MSKISKKDLSQFLGDCDCEGFDYALENCEPETKDDEKLKSLIEDYAKAKSELKDYLTATATEYGLEDEAEVLEG